MEIDIMTVILAVVSIIIGALVYKVFNAVQSNKIDMVFDKMKVFFEKYGPTLEKDNPELYAKVKSAIDTMESAYTDGSISALEALEIASKFYPLLEELIKFAQGVKAKA